MLSWLMLFYVFRLSRIFDAFPLKCNFNVLRNKPKPLKRNRFDHTLRFKNSKHATYTTNHEIGSNSLIFTIYLSLRIFTFCLNEHLL
jgi:hypothetical protein